MINLLMTNKYSMYFFILLIILLFTPSMNADADDVNNEEKQSIDSDDNNDDDVKCPTRNYYNSSIAKCTVCPLACATCKDSITCTSCFSGTTLVSSAGTKLCRCSSPSLFFNIANNTCGTCSVVLPNCGACTALRFSISCKTCITGYFLKTSTCIACKSPCKTCSSETACLSCITGYTLSGGICSCGSACTNCQSLIPGCVTCKTSPLSCSVCTIGYYLSGSTCVACAPGCSVCNPTACTMCLTGYLLVSGVCQTCDIAISKPNCIECTPDQCTICASGFTLNLQTLLCNPTSTITCNANQVDISGTCFVCSALYDPMCDSCDATACLTCSGGLFYNAATSACQSTPIANVCGDGNWDTVNQPCDDGNNLNDDGCDANCRVETDYECLAADQLPSGASFCKYTLPLSITFNHLLKDSSSNKVDLYFTLQPSTFKQWSSQQALNLISPVEIVDSNTGAATVIPYNSLTSLFQRKNEANEMVLSIDYGQQSIENTYIRYTVDPTQTNFPSIQSQPVIPTSYVLLSSQNNAVNLYNYSQETYDFQKTIFYFSSFIGYLSCVFLFIGLVCPVGKLIVVEALAVVQITFFSLLQFDKVPPTFIGFRGLILSNGYNYPFYVGPTSHEYVQNVYGLMGLSEYTFTNYNITFIISFLLPFLVGLIGYLAIRFSKQKKQISDNKQNKQLLIKNQTKIKFFIFKRILFEWCFYGMIISGYLIWISGLKSLKFNKLINIVALVIYCFIFISYSILFLYKQIRKINIQRNQSFQKNNDNNKQILNQKAHILNNFGQFGDVFQQVSQTKEYGGHKLQKIYAAFILQRIIVSILFTFLQLSFSYTSLIVLAFQSLILSGLIISVKKFANANKQKEQKKSIRSYLYRNYIFRQSINLISIILISLLFLVEHIEINNSKNLETTLTKEMMITKTIPIMILSLLAINLIFNIFLWIWQIKNSQIINKIKLIKGDVNEFDAKQQNNHENNEKQELLTQKKNKKQKGLFLDEEFMQTQIKQYIQSSKILNNKNSPFIGLQERQQKVFQFKVQQIQKSNQINSNEEQLNGSNELHLDERRKNKKDNKLKNNNEEKNVKRTQITIQKSLFQRLYDEI